MAYNATYDGDDLGLIVVDGLGAIFVAVVGLAVIFGLVILWRLVKNKKLL